MLIIVPDLKCCVYACIFDEEVNLFLSHHPNVDLGSMASLSWSIRVIKFFNSLPRSPENEKKFQFLGSNYYEN